MTASDFVDDVREANQTALSRLGSSKALYAETDGDLETEQVFRAAAIAEDAAGETFTTWANNEADDDAAALFEDVADEEADHYETVAAELDEPPRADDGDLPADPVSAPWARRYGRTDRRRYWPLSRREEIKKAVHRLLYRRGRPPDSESVPWAWERC